MVETETSSPLAPDPACRVRWFGVFQSPSWEKEYRIHELPESIKIARIFIGIVVAAFLAFLVNDYRFFGTSTMMGWMVALRVVIIVGSFLVMGLVRNDMSPAKFDFVVIAWSLGTKTAMLAVVATRPANFIGYAVVIVMSILLTYWIMPLPLLWRALTSWFLTIGVLIVGFLIHPWPDGPTAIAMTLALVLTNVIGGEMCREQQIWRRRQFLALRQQQELSANLELALGEIKTLRGIVPICMHCKRISNDAGRWEPIEAYVHRHSHAEFSHGLCPECAHSHYPEIDWEDSRRQRELRAKSNLPGS